MLSSTLRREASKLARGLRTSALARGGGAHEPEYIHAKHMYDVQGMSNRKLKWGLTAIGMVGGGTAVVAIAINHQQKKAAG